MEAFVVDANQRTIGVFVFEAEELEDFHSAGTALFQAGQFRGNAAGEIGAVAVPGGGIVRLTRSLPVDVGKNHEAVAVFGPEELRVFIEQIARLPVEADAHGDAIAVHELDPVVECFTGAVEFVAEMRVDINNGQLGSC